jgi:hypothetical protein
LPNAQGVTSLCVADEAIRCAGVDLVWILILLKQHCGLERSTELDRSYSTTKVELYPIKNGNGFIYHRCSPASFTGRNGLIVLKKSNSIFSTDKYALEIEILTFGRGFRTLISRSNVQKWRFHRSRNGSLGKTDFFNRIG